jgi:hypothetical protein
MTDSVPWEAGDDIHVIDAGNIPFFGQHTTFLKVSSGML